MAYTVFGFQSGVLDTPRLHQESIKAKAFLAPFQWQERMMRGYAVDTHGFDLLEKRFNVIGAFQNFYLLDEVAIEACAAFKVSLGVRLGTIEINELGGLAIRMFAWPYYNDTQEPAEKLSD
jgi:hypothetical protein